MTADGGAADLGHASNVLVVDASGSDDWLLANYQSVAGDDAPIDTLLSVAFTGTAQQRYDAVRRRMDPRPREIDVLGVDERTRSAAASSAGRDRADPVDPFNLTRLGIDAHTALSERTAADDRVVVFVRSLGDLLDHAELRQVFRFLHVLTEETAARGARGYYRVDADCPRRTVRTLQPLFDAVVDVSADGSYTVRDPIAVPETTGSAADSETADPGPADRGTADSASGSTDHRQPAERAVDRLCRLTPWLWMAAIVTFGFGDILTTFFGIRTGVAVEASPIAAEIIKANGLGFVYVVKATVVGLLYLLWKITPSPHRVGVPLGLSLLGVGVTAWNASVVVDSVGVLAAVL